MIMRVDPRVGTELEGHNRGVNTAGSIRRDHEVRQSSRPHGVFEASTTNRTQSGINQKICIFIPQIVSKTKTRG